MTLTPLNGGNALDLVGLGANFTLTVESSAQYRAVLSGFGAGGVEEGRLSYENGMLVLHRESPSPSEDRARLTHSGNSVVLEGAAEFDFNRDGFDEPAESRIELERTG